MKTLLIIAFVVVIGLAIIGGGLVSFVEDVGKGGEKVAESGIFESVFEKSSAIIEDVISESSPSGGVSQEEMQIALRIKELNDKGNEITASEYKELQTLIETYERNWGR